MFRQFIEQAQITIPPEDQLTLPSKDDIQKVEALVGRLPESYVCYLREIGAGIIADTWSFSCPGVDFFERLTQAWMRFSPSRALDERWANIRLFPEPNGLITLGVSSYDHWLLWRSPARKSIDPDEYGEFLIVRSDEPVGTHCGSFFSLILAILHHTPSLDTLRVEIERPAMFRAFATDSREDSVAMLKELAELAQCESSSV